MKICYNMSMTFRHNPVSVPQVRDESCEIGLTPPYLHPNMAPHKMRGEVASSGCRTHQSHPPHTHLLRDLGQSAVQLHVYHCRAILSILAYFPLGLASLAKIYHHLASQMIPIILIQYAVSDRFHRRLCDFKGFVFH